jgi:hypothetical protein
MRLAALCAASRPCSKTASVLAVAPRPRLRCRRFDCTIRVGGRAAWRPVSRVTKAVQDLANSEDQGLASSHSAPPRHVLVLASVRAPVRTRPAEAPGARVRPSKARARRSSRAAAGVRPHQAPPWHLANQPCRPRTSGLRATRSSATSAGGIRAASQRPRPKTPSLAASGAVSPGQDSSGTPQYSAAVPCWRRRWRKRANRGEGARRAAPAPAPRRRLGRLRRAAANIARVIRPTVVSVHSRACLPQSPPPSRTTKPASARPRPRPTARVCSRAPDLV